MNDAEIVKHRSLKAEVLSTPELVKMRRAVAELYDQQAQADRHAATTARHLGVRAAATQSESALRQASSNDAAWEAAWSAYERVGRDIERCSARIAETSAHADDCFKAWLVASAGYEQRRRELLDAAGVDDEIAGLELSAERARREALEHHLVDLPPMGWGLKRYPNIEDRIAAWRRRPMYERRSLGARQELA